MRRGFVIGSCWCLDRNKVFECWPEQDESARVLSVQRLGPQFREALDGFQGGELDHATRAAMSAPRRALRRGSEPGHT